VPPQHLSDLGVKKVKREQAWGLLEHAPSDAGGVRLEIQEKIEDRRGVEDDHVRASRSARTASGDDSESRTDRRLAILCTNS
jgi:hypothetical protein